MSTAVITLIVSVLTLVILSGVFRIEDAREGRLLLLGKVRRFFDRVIVNISTKLTSLETYLGKGSLRLTLHYVLHGILHFVLSLVIGTQKKVENLLRRNKQVVKKIRTDKEKTHLDKIADHKKEVALTDAQKTKMRSHE